MAPAPAFSQQKQTLKKLVAAGCFHLCCFSSCRWLRFLLKASLKWRARSKELIWMPLRSKNHQWRTAQAGPITDDSPAPPTPLKVVWVVTFSYRCFFHPSTHWIFVYYSTAKKKCVTAKNSPILKKSWGDKWKISAKNETVESSFREKTLAKASVELSGIGGAFASVWIW